MIEYPKISRWFELQKQKAEDEFKIKYYNLQSQIEELEDTKAELQAVQKKLSELEAHFEKEDFKIVITNQKRIKELQDTINGYEFNDILSAMKEKSGELYVLLQEKADLASTNYQERDTLAKLLVLALKLSPQDRNAVYKILEKGCISKKLNLGSDAPLVHRFLTRLKIAVILEGESLSPGPIERCEVPVLIHARRIWLPKETAEKVSEMEKKLKELSARMHIKIAQSELNSDLQSEYLAILQEQDKLLSYHKEEEALFLPLETINQKSP